MKQELRKKSKQFKQMIDAASSIIILGHIRPDGDCVGSTLAVYNYIVDNYKDKDVDVYMENFSDKFAFLRNADKVKHEPEDKHYDLGISLDVSEGKRHGKFSDMYQSAISTICIDHHESNKGFGDLCYIDSGASSTCEVLSDFLDMEKVSKATAECLYLGIIHDTGVFNYSSTSYKTMEFAGQLLEKGVNSSFMIDETFYKKSYKQNLLLARTILESNLYADGKIISGYVTRETFKDFDCSSIDTDGIVEQLRLTDGVEVAIFAYQLTKKNTKFSLRSKNYVNVNEIAGFFGGGGHEKAAGFETTSSYQRVMKKLIGLIEKQLKD